MEKKWGEDTKTSNAEGHNQLGMTHEKDEGPHLYPHLAHMKGYVVAAISCEQVVHAPMAMGGKNEQGGKICTDQHVCKQHKKEVICGVPLRC